MPRKSLSQATEGLVQQHETYVELTLDDLYSYYSLKKPDWSLLSVYNDSVRVFRMLYLVFPNMCERTTYSASTALIPADGAEYKRMHAGLLQPAVIGQEANRPLTRSDLVICLNYQVIDHLGISL